MALLIKYIVAFFYRLMARFYGYNIPLFKDYYEWVEEDDDEINNFFDDNNFGADEQC